MINVFINVAGRDYGTLGELNARHASAKACLAAARSVDDPEADGGARISDGVALRACPAPILRTAVHYSRSNKTPLN